MCRSRGFDASAILAAAAFSLAVAGCSDDGVDASADAGADADAGMDAGADADAGTDAGPTNAARVFAIDPYLTPTPFRTDLVDVADDADGALVTAAREDGVRRIQVLTCLDRGDTSTNPLTGKAQRICTLAPVADKGANGSFLYDDFADAAACVFDPDDASAEVNAYYHVSKIYDLVASPEVGVFDLLPGRHFVGKKPVPLTVVVNYREPVAASEASLPPTDCAFFLSHEYLVMGMSVFQGLPGIPGDVLAFGQGASTDFAYSGQTIYHEFGHALTNATAALGQILVDAQGMTNQPAALDEGVANTMAFLGSDEPLAGEFLSACSGFNFLFGAEADAVFPGDAIGHPVVDGNPVLSANWDLASALVPSWGGTKADFVRVLLLSLQDLGALGGEVRFADYAEALLARLTSEGFAQHETAARAILDAHGLTSTARVVDLTGSKAEENRVLYMGCAAEEMWNTVMRADLGEGVVPFATALVQNSAVVAAGASSLTVSAHLVERPSTMSKPGDWDFRLLVRLAGPVTYAFDDDGVATATYDKILAPSIVPGDADEATWTVGGLAAGTTVYFQFLNLGATEGILAQIAVE